MEQKEKELIASRLRDYCTAQGGQNKAANTLKGVSAATISKLLNGDWDTIAEGMWHNVSKQIGSSAEGWSLVSTSVYDELTELLECAQTDSQVMAIVGSAGCGKSATIRQYASTHDEVTAIVCSEYQNRTSWLSAVMEAMGLDPRGLSVAEKIGQIVRRLKRADKPLLILDEADKMSDQVLYFFVTLYNELDGHCGVVLCATQYLDKRLVRGLRSGRKGYEEVYSRIGRQCIQLSVLSPEDISLVCVANGITGERKVRKIADEAECDLRRVRRAVWREHQLAKED
ncbi:ATP-binding protein [uncultured Porphyromonas sp.]|uniref:ATP-binding protein n=1 Tax=uncultured Porphyromonas sp. TaxID=159274 RepID=UPI00261D16C6|nr:ATP-binding protein [uncultured Porphyromonas sp.]